MNIEDLFVGSLVIYSVTPCIDASITWRGIVTDTDLGRGLEGYREHCVRIRVISHSQTMIGVGSPFYLDYYRVGSLHVINCCLLRHVSPLEQLAGATE